MTEKNAPERQKRREGAVRDSAHSQFQEALLDGRLRPGQLVNQRDLIDMMGLSIGALREVLPRLQSEGLIHVLPQRGIQIPAIDLPLIREAFQMRAALEREAVIHAIKNMSDDILREQHALHTRIVDSVKSAPTDALLQQGQEIDDQFHTLLIHSTKNGVLIRAYEINSIRIRLIKLDRTRLSQHTLPDAFTDHLAIIDALLARDKFAAIEASDRHLANARNRALEL